MFGSAHIDFDRVDMLLQLQEFAEVEKAVVGALVVDGHWAESDSM